MTMEGFPKVEELFLEASPPPQTALSNDMELIKDTVCELQQQLEQLKEMVEGLKDEDNTKKL